MSHCNLALCSWSSNLFLHSQGTYLVCLLKHYFLSFITTRVDLFTHEYLPTTTNRYFPYYELYMFIRNPKTFPGGGVRIEIVRTENRRETSYLELKSNRASIGALFWRLNQQLKHFRTAYSLGKIVDCALYAKAQWLDGVQRLCMIQYPGICSEDLRAPRMFWRDMTTSL